ncbi:MAG: hypothetical protein HYY24_14745 [Verrucomicrobia bacterium]|nr:hypothetical protein [Verrucomicrobiota bacterium]
MRTGFLTSIDERQPPQRVAPKVLVCAAFTWLALASPALAVPLQLGDLDGDQKPTVLDLVRMVNHVNGNPVLSADLQRIADVNQDSVVDQSDISLLADAILGLTPLPDVPEIDADGDAVPDIVEALMGYDPTKADTDGNGVKDGDEDFDLDGLKNKVEFSLRIDPGAVDTDGDDWDDASEVGDGSDPANAASGPILFVESAPVTFLNAVPEEVGPDTISLVSSPLTSYLNGLGDLIPGDQLLVVNSGLASYLNALPEVPLAETLWPATSGVVSYLNGVLEDAPRDFFIASPVVSYQNQ